MAAESALPEPRPASPGPSVEIIAEIANAHQGDPALAERLAREAVAAGADAVKFQVYLAEELLVRRHPRFEHFERQAFDAGTWRALISGARSQGARVYCDVFGSGALTIAADSNADGFKTHSSDLGNEPLVRAIAGRGRPVFLAVGGSTAREIARAVSWVRGSGGRRPVLLHGFQSYPTVVADACLSRLAWLRETFGDRCDVGYMDHVDGEDPFAIHLPMVAIGMGASVLEKHITLDRAARGVDYYSSLNPDEFTRFVRSVRQTCSAIGGAPIEFVEAEREYRRQVKKHWVAARPLPEGHVLEAGDLVMKRVADHPAEVPEPGNLLGRPLRRGCPEEHVFSRADVPRTVWALVVARMRSTRLPAKALADVEGMPAIRHLLERLKQVRTLDRIVLCTTTEPEDGALVEQARTAGVEWHCGPSEDVLARMIGAMEGHAVDAVLRVTGDDILVDPEYADRAVAHHMSINAEYSDLKALPSGTEVEVFDAGLLRTLHAAAMDPSGTEYLTSYVIGHRDQFRVAHVPVDAGHARFWRLTLDTPEDLEVIRMFAGAMRSKGKLLDYRLADVVEYFENHPELLAVNASVRHRGTPAVVRTDLDWRRVQ